MKALQALSKHWPVDLVQQSTGYVHYAVRSDTHQVAVIGEVVNRTEREAVDDRRDSARASIFDDVGRLHQRLLPQCADGAPMSVRGQHTLAKTVLVKPATGLLQGVGTDVGGRHGA